MRLKTRILLSFSVIDPLRLVLETRGCLMARRLVERSARMVRIFYGKFQPWEDHTDVRGTVVKDLIA